jgi:glutaminyl-peptide cyclotransferase
MADSRDARGVRSRYLVSLLLILTLLAAAGCTANNAGAGEEATESQEVTVTQATRTPTVPVMPSPTATPVPVFSGARAMEDVENQMAFGPRPTGSEAATLTGDYILSELDEAGWETDTQPFEYQGVQARNLIGRSPSGESSQVYILGAHYDTRRRADQDSNSPDAPVPGANDGASGAAVLLELARVVDLSAVDGSVWLVFFDAEDNGHLDGWDWIIGSRRFAERLDFQPEYVIVVDMIGDADQNIYLEANSDPALQDHIWKIAAQLGYANYFIPEVRHSMLDDHTPFLEKGITAVDIIDFDYPYWHTTADTADKVSAESLERVGRTLETLLESGGAYEPAVAE